MPGLTDRMTIQDSKTRKHGYSHHETEELLRAKGETRKEQWRSKDQQQMGCHHTCTLMRPQLEQEKAVRRNRNLGKRIAGMSRIQTIQSTVRPSPLRL